MNKIALIAIFAVGFAVFLLMQLPLAAAVAWSGLSAGLGYQRAEGALWNGTLTGAVWQGIALGDVTVAVRPAALLLGRVSIDLVLDGGPVSGRGRVERGLGTALTITDAVLTADVARLPALIPMTGQMNLAIARLDFAADGCRSADATVETNALTRRPGGLDWNGPVLTGHISCQDGTLTIPLQGGEGPERIATSLALRRDLSFAVEILVRTEASNIALALPAFGFQRENGAYVLRQSGRLGGLQGES